MGSLKQDRIAERKKENTRNFMESKLSKGSILKKNCEFQELQVENEFLKSQIAKLEAEGEKLKIQQVSLLEDDLTPLQDPLINNRLKFMSRTLDDLSSMQRQKLKVNNKAIVSRLDASIPSDRAQLKEYFTCLNYDLTKNIPEDFKICVDCKQFKAFEVQVTVKDGYVTVQGRHDFKLDKHGVITREFTRRWTIPKNVEMEKFSCLLDKYGILTVRAPHKVSSYTIPIQTAED